MFLQDDLSHWYGGSRKLLTAEIAKQWREGREERQELGRGQDDKKKGRMWKERQASELSLRSSRLSLRPPRSKAFPYACFSGACLLFLAAPSPKNEAGLHVGRGSPSVPVQSFASHIAANESNRTSYATSEKGVRVVSQVPNVPTIRMRCSLIISRTAVFALYLLVFPTPSLLAQATGGTSSAPNISLPGQQSPFLGSAPEGNATAEVLKIDFKDAIDRGLRNNLGLLLASDQAETARGERWKELSEPLPNLSAHVLQNVQSQRL